MEEPIVELEPEPIVELLNNEEPIVELEP